ncbi:hypothetical protein J4E93_000992 [Alternaria ventricosa]|uniref:uncharacterized protein n=1 Tax=Alternaria ventricosa TaxID=1187951 RepID=UPI0020C56E4C|nr:uncharacterized protein J4E93_000992 [Alternaria ventricosa]KAI4656273.1 hypothetical protein J4E93_000992 [Alternaria ventricosa]
MFRAAKATGTDYFGWDERKALEAIVKAVAIYPRLTLDFVAKDYLSAKRNLRKKKWSLTKRNRLVLRMYGDDDIAALAIYNQIKPRHRQRILAEIRHRERQKKALAGGFQDKEGM